MKYSGSDLEEILKYQIKLSGLPEPEIEYKFHETRRWRFDFAYPDIKLAIEIEGGTWTKGRHTRGAGFEADCRKYAAAMELGWNVYRCTGGMVKSGEALSTIEILIDMSNKRNNIVEE